MLRRSAFSRPPRPLTPFWCVWLLVAGYLLATLERDVPVRAQTVSPASIPQEQSVPGGRYFRQAGGFAVTDQRGIPFYAVFLRFGGTTEMGFPVSRRFFLDGFT